MRDIRWRECHIIAFRINGPRGKNRNNTNIDSYENHILLCPFHHSEVDKNQEYFTEDYLLSIKRDHEALMSACTDTSLGRKNIVSFLNAYFRYSGFGRIPDMLGRSPRIFPVGIGSITDFFYLAMKDFPFVVPFRDIELHHLFYTLIQSFEELNCALRGSEHNTHFVSHNFWISPTGDNIILQENELSEDYCINLRSNLSYVVDRCYRSFNELGTYIRRNYPEVII